MVTLRYTAKLLKRLPKLFFDAERTKVSTSASVSAPTSAPASTTLLGDWYLHLLVMRPQHLAVCTCQHTRLTLILPAKELKTLPQRMATQLAVVLADFGVPSAQIEHETAQMQEWRITPTSQGTDYQKVLGTQRQMILSLDYLYKSEYDQMAWTRYLNSTLFGPPPYRHPDQTTRELFMRNFDGDTDSGQRELIGSA